MGSSRPPAPADDATLLRRYATDRDEAAFTELVRRHLDAVHSSALRRCDGDAHAARDVVQQAFIALARHAAKLAAHPALVAWLFTATRHAAAKFRRTEHRRRVRETTAMNDGLLADDGPAPDWRAVRPVLEAALDELNDADRTVVLLRFFERRTFAEVGARLGVNDHAARMRTERALERLRGRLAARGITSSTAALGAVLAAHAVAPAPAGLATLVAATAVGAASGSFLAVWWTWLAGTAKVAATNGWVAGTFLVALAGGTALVVSERRTVTTIPAARVSANADPAEIAPSDGATPAADSADAPVATNAPDSGDSPATARSARTTGASRATPLRPAAAERGDAEALWRLVIAAYGGLTSYRDTGTLVDSETTDTRRTHVLRFETAYRAPDRFSFRWDGRVRGEDGQILNAAGRIWIRGSVAGYVVSEPTSSRGTVTPTQVIAIASASRMAATDVPAMFFAGIRREDWVLARLPPKRTVGEVTVSGLPCRSIHATGDDDERWSISVGRDDLLVRQIFWTPSRAVRATLTRSSVPVDSFEALARWRILETRENIRVNETLPDELFADGP